MHFYVNEQGIMFISDE